MLPTSDLNLNDFPQLLTNFSPLDAASEMEIRRQADTSWMTEKSHICDYESFILDESHKRYTICYNDVPFECLYLPKSHSKRLYVMLSGGGRKGKKVRYPLFLRWKYNTLLDGNILCIDDPMMSFHNKINHVMWYYGTKDVSYMHLLIDIIKKVILQLSINAKDVTFIGSSGGGYAALYAANLLDYSSAFAMNPQYIPKNWGYPVIYNNFSKWGLNLDIDDQFGRNKLNLTNKTSTFMIMMNAASNSEYNLQFVPFMNDYNIVPQYGISQKDNIITWIHSTPYKKPHSASATKVGIAFADYLLKKAKLGVNLNEIKNLSVLANELLYEKYSSKESLEYAESLLTETDNFYQFLMQTISNHIKNILSVKIVELSSNSLKNFFFDNYDITSSLGKKSGMMSFYIGTQKACRYTLSYNQKNKNWYFCMKFTDFSTNFANSNQALEYLSSLINDNVDWILEDTDRLKLSIILTSNAFEQQINELINLSINLINKYL